jgi:mRNA deadenylase 3'-5' endonuclease subunit Ccr4
VTLVSYFISAIQEVSPSEFNGFFFPQLQQLGYDGVFQPKKKLHAMDGCATFCK